MGNDGKIFAELEAELGEETPENESAPAQTTGTDFNDTRACEESPAPRGETSDEKSSSQSGRARALILTDELLLRSNVSAGARLVTAAVVRSVHQRHSPSARDLARALGANRGTVIRWLTEAETAGLLTRSGGKRKPGTKYNARYLYEIPSFARPSPDKHFVVLELTPGLGKSAEQRILRAVLLREQRIAKAIQLPMGIAARIAGMSLAAEKKARQRWIQSGEMRMVANGQAVPTYSLISETYPLDLQRFDPTRRKLGKLTVREGHKLTLWGTPKQIAKARGIVAVSFIADEIADAFPQSGAPVAAHDVLSLEENLDWNEVLFKRRNGDEPNFDFSDLEKPPFALPD